MQMPDLEVFRDIPGYRPILKAVLKTQIQALVEQLSKQTGEESVIVTASLEDGSLTHLGSDYGKVFLDSHDQFKSQFLGFCLKRNQMLLKTKVPPLNTARKKGPVARGRRPRLAPYHNTNPSRKAPHKTLPQPSQYNQNYSQELEPAYSVTDVKPGTSTETKTVVKIEPGLENEEQNQIGEPADEDKVYIENMSRAFPESGYLGDEVTMDTKDKHGVQLDESFKYSNNDLHPRHESIDDLTTQPQTSQPIPTQLKLERSEFDTEDTGSDVIPPIPDMDSDVPEESGSFEIPRCTICSKRFKNIRNLKFHMMTHSGIRPYACLYCPKRFSQKNVLDQHLLIHTGQKPFACAVCGKCFTQRATKYRHERAHIRDMTQKLPQ